MKIQTARGLVIALFIFIVCESALLIGLPSLDYFHRDEVNWTRVSIYSFRTFFVERDFSDEGWSESFRSWGSYNPQVGKFLIGASLWLHGYRDFEGVVHFEEYKHEDLQHLIQQGIVPPPEELYAARLPVAILTAGTASLVFVLAALAHESVLGEAGWISGILASLYFFFHPLVQSYGRHATVDMPALFFSTLALTLTLMSGLAFFRHSLGRSVLLSVGASGAVGLAISTKMNALLIWPVVLLSAVTLALMNYQSQDQASIKLRCANLMLLLGLPVVIFVLSNPFLYSDPVGGILHMLRLSRRVANYRPRFPDKALYSIQERVGAFIDLGFGSFEKLLHGQYGQYIDILLAGAGVAAMVYALLRMKRTREAAFVMYILSLWTMVTAVGIVLWSPLAWDRYYIPWTPIVSVWVGIGVARLVAMLLKLLARISHKVCRRFYGVVLDKLCSHGARKK